MLGYLSFQQALIVCDSNKILYLQFFRDKVQFKNWTCSDSQNIIVVMI